MREYSTQEVLGKKETKGETSDCAGFTWTIFKAWFYSSVYQGCTSGFSENQIFLHCFENQQRIKDIIHSCSSSSHQSNWKFVYIRAIVLCETVLFALWVELVIFCTLQYELTTEFNKLHKKIQT